MTRKLHVPPLGVRLSHDIEVRSGRIRARVRWVDQVSKQRRSYSKTVADRTAADVFFERLDAAAGTNIDPYVTFSAYADAIGDRWLRGVDLTSTAAGYRVGLRLRVVPALGHLPICRISTGIIDRTIDRWEESCSSSTIKQSVAALTRILDEAVRDEVVDRNPARARARRTRPTPPGSATRQQVLPDLAALFTLADACERVHLSYHDHVLLCALLAARGSEVAGLRVGDIDWNHGVVIIERQCYPGHGGLRMKPPKGRRARRVPILEALAPTLRRLTKGREAEEPLLRGPHGGVITSASLRRATDWDTLLIRLGHNGFRRHGLRHTGATWLANAGVPLDIIARILGHTLLETTRTYLHIDDRQLTEAADTVNQHLRQYAEEEFYD
ncbi:tyrosine-type recombinase/integrase [Rhodoglobus sp.]